MHHTVQQGDWLAKIARQYGFRDWRTIYNHPDNTELRRLRPNPNLLYPGDRIYIPEKEIGEVTCATEIRHRFQLRSQRESLSIRIWPSTNPIDKNSPRPAKAMEYRLTIGSHEFRGETNQEGLLQIAPLPPHASEGVLEVMGYRLRILIGHLDPVDEITGVQARLNQLGYDAGTVDGLLGPRTKAAISAFQALNDLEVDGMPNRQTKEKIAALCAS